jgi:hypothetical protein
MLFSLTINGRMEVIITKSMKEICDELSEELDDRMDAGNDPNFGDEDWEDDEE